MKYIMLEVPMGTLVERMPIMFPNNLVHSIVAEALLAHPTLKHAKVVSAGEFSSLDLVGVSFHGKSTSLKLIAREDDDAFLPSLDYGGGII